MLNIIQIFLRFIGLAIIIAVIFISTSNGELVASEYGVSIKNSSFRVLFGIDDSLPDDSPVDPAENDTPIWGTFDGRSFVFVIFLMVGVVLLSVEVDQYKFFLKNFLFRSPTRVQSQVNDLVKRLRKMSDDYYRGGAKVLKQGVNIKKMPPVWPLLIDQLELKIPFEDIVIVLGNEAGITRKSYDNIIRLLSTFSNLAPSLGVIGTVLGLVRLLYNLEDPTTLGPSMALALLTTLYGLLLSVVVLKPLMVRFENIREAQMNAYQYAMFWMTILDARLPSFYTEQNYIENRSGGKKK